MVAVQSSVTRRSDFLSLTKPDSRLSDSLIRLTSSTVYPSFSNSVLIADLAASMSPSLNSELHEFM
jgi:hypothetical protein